MVRLVGLLASILFLAPVPRAWAGAHEPICRAPSVLELMEREVRRRDHYARIEPRLVDEVPDVKRNVVLCGVPVWTLSYDARRAVGVAFGRCESHEFRVQALLNGFVVVYLR
jgi:hypothetical protein